MSNTSTDLQKTFLALYPRRSAVRLQLQDAVQPTEANWLVGDQDLQLLIELESSLNLTLQLMEVGGHVVPELVQNAAHFLKKKNQQSHHKVPVMEKWMHMNRRE